MKYVIEATGSDCEDASVPVEIDIDGKRENTTIIFHLNDKQSWWIPINELDHLMAIIDVLFSQR